MQMSNDYLYINNSETIEDHNTHLVSFSTLSDHSYILEYKDDAQNDYVKEGDSLLEQKDNKILWKEEGVIGDEMSQPFNVLEMNHYRQLNDPMYNEGTDCLLSENKENDDKVVVLKNNLSEFMHISRNDFLKYQEERWSILQIENNNIEVLGKENMSNGVVEDNNHLELINEGKMKVAKRKRKPFDVTKFQICSFSPEILDKVINDNGNQPINDQQEDTLVDKEKEGKKPIGIDANAIAIRSSNDDKSKQMIDNKEEKIKRKEYIGDDKNTKQDNINERNEDHKLLENNDNNIDNTHEKEDMNKDEIEQEEHLVKVNSNKDEKVNEEKILLNKDSKDNIVNQQKEIPNQNGEREEIKNINQSFKDKDKENVDNNDDENKIKNEDIDNNLIVNNKFTFQEENNVIPDHLQNEDILQNNNKMILTKVKDSIETNKDNQQALYITTNEKDNTNKNTFRSIVSNTNVSNDRLGNKEMINEESLANKGINKSNDNIPLINAENEKTLLKKEDNQQKDDNENANKSVGANVNDNNQKLVDGKNTINKIEQTEEDKYQEIYSNNKEDDVEIMKQNEIERLALIKFEKMKQEELESLNNKEIQKRTKEKGLESQQEIYNNKKEDQNEEKTKPKENENNSNDKTPSIPIPPPLIDLTNLYTLAKKYQQQRYRIIKNSAIEIIDNPFKGNNEKGLSNSFISDVKKNNHSLSKDSNSGELTKLKESLSKNVDSKKQKKRGRGRRTLDDKQIQLQQPQELHQQEANLQKESPKKLSIELSKVESDNTNRTITIEKLPEINTNDLLSTHTEISKESNEETEDFRNRSFTQNKKYEFHPNYSKDSSINSNEDNRSNNNFRLNNKLQNKRSMVYNNKLSPYSKNVLKKYQGQDDMKENVNINKNKNKKKTNSKDKSKSKSKSKIKNANKQSRLKIGYDEKDNPKTMVNKQKSIQRLGLSGSKGKNTKKTTLNSKTETVNNNVKNYNSNNNNHPITLRNGPQKQLKPITNNNSSSYINNKESTWKMNQEWKTTPYLANKPLSSASHKQINSNDTSKTNSVIQNSNKTLQDFKLLSKPPSTYFPVPSCCNCQHVHNPPNISHKDLNSGYEYWLENRKRKTFSSKTSRYSSVRDLHNNVSSGKMYINLNEINKEQKQRKTFSNITNEEIERKRKQIMDLLKDPQNPYSTYWQDKLLGNGFNMGLASNGTINNVPVLTIVKKKEEPTEEKFNKIQQELIRQKSLETSKYYNKSSLNFHPCSKKHNNGVDYRTLDNYNHIEYPSIFKYFN